MISIRANLLCWLLPGFAAICLIAGAGIYFSTQFELEAKMDARLNELADDIRLRPQPPGSKQNRRDRKFSAAEFEKITRRKSFDWNNIFTNLPPDAYCELQLETRDKHIKSENLSGLEIPHPAKFTEEAVFYNASLDNGDPVRARAETMTASTSEKSPKILVAVSRRELDETLIRLLTKLIAGSICCCALFAGILTLGLKMALKPLRLLGEQAAEMNAESLNKRFPEQSIPADIRPIVERLNGLIAKLEESFARERRFSGDIAHELRTPLAAIRATSEVAIKWPDQARSDDFIAIEQLSAQLQQTLDSLLLLARMESSAAESLREPVNLEQLIQECAALYRDAAQQRDITLSLQLENSPEFNSDPRLLRIICSNLIHNAIDYAPASSTVRLTSNSKSIFRCTNEAPNLTPDDTSHLFERLWRKDKARTESDHTGLGLSIALSCAKQLGLNLSAEMDTNKQLCILLNP